MKFIASKMSAAMKAIDAVTKSGKNTQQGYNYVKAADVANEVRKALSESGIAFHYQVTNERFWQYERGENKSPMFFCSLTVEGVFIDSESGESVTSTAIGWGADTQDKAPYKAMTGALKYLLRMTFLIPDESDPENDSAEEKPQVSRFQQQAKASLATFRPGVDFDPAEFNESQEEPPLEAYEDPFGHQGKRQNPDADMVPVSTPLQKAQQAISKAPAKASGTISEGQIKRLWAIAKGAGKDKGDVMGIVGEFGFDTVDAIGWQKYNAIIERIQS